jgi:predicted DNA-binding helix-hairpin-helix protein
MILEKLQKLGMAASYDSCGGGREKSFREYGIPYEYQNFIYNCTNSSENVFVKKMVSDKRQNKKLYEKEEISEEVKKEAWEKMSRVLPTSKNDSLNKPNKCLLTKVLQTNSCMHDCAYCVNTSCKEKVSITPNELATSFEYLWKNGYTTGLFLSSAVRRDATISTEEMIATTKILRERGYKGYIHLKVLPDTPEYLVKEAALYANRMSINIESTTSSGFSELTSTKDYKEGVLRRINTLDKLKREVIRKEDYNSGWFCDSKQIQNGEDYRFRSFTTQVIVGANQETDKDILNRVNSLYEETELYRTYFSAFSPVEGTKLMNKKPENKTREHRLYEVDWLLRIYGFDKRLISQGLNDENNFSLACDVKQSIALARKDLFPLDPNTATYEELLLVPGFGPKTAEAIIQNREGKKINEFKDLEKIGVRVNKAKSFLNIEGKQTNLLNF